MDHDTRDEKLGYKITEAQMSKVPFILVLGDKEVKEETVNVRKYGEKTTSDMKLDEFISTIKQAIANRSIDKSFQLS